MLVSLLAETWYFPPVRNWLEQAAGSGIAAVSRQDDDLLLRGPDHQTKVLHDGLALKWLSRADPAVACPVTWELLRTLDFAEETHEFLAGLCFVGKVSGVRFAAKSSSFMTVAPRDYRVGAAAVTKSLDTSVQAVKLSFTDTIATALYQRLVDRLYRKTNGKR